MTARQCEIAAESYAASLMAQSGFDVLVQYGAYQPHYDLVVEREGAFHPVSVKGSQDGGWMLAVRHKKKGGSYHEAINLWRNAQRKDVLFVFVQFLGVSVSDAPRAYVAGPEEIAIQLKAQRDGLGYGSLQEDYRRDHPRSKYSHRIPEAWLFSEERLRRLVHT